MKKKIISIFLMAVMCMSMISGTFASGTASLRIGENTITEYADYNETDDLFDYSEFSPTSKICYESLVVLEFWDYTDMPQNMNSFADLVTYFKSIGINSIAAGNVSKDELRIGDIIQMKNSDSPFLVYTGTENDGDITLEDLENSYECSPETFNLLFTGNVVLVNHTASNKSSKMSQIDAENVKNIRLESNATSTSPMMSGKSKTAQGVRSWDNAVNNPRIKTLAKQLHKANSNWGTKILNIWNWMRNHIEYEKKPKFKAHKDTKHSPDWVLDNRAGNCCEQARLFVALARASGVAAQFIHVPQTKTHIGHVFPRGRYATGKWINVDTCYSWGYNRPTPSWAKKPDDVLRF